ncbi:porin family protein [Flavicella sediminum]|uniref:porin family protein n=1 Tax=Flavicella sediminum TaxID=2585141 RepID=UPI001123F4B5|nr:porin family protein [Flavicella sediminum]
MKKIIFSIALAVAAIQFTNAQISFGVKGGMNIDLNSEASKYVEVPSGFSLNTEKSSGYNFGAWLRVKVPVVGLYVRPEINYTSLSTDYSIGYPEFTYQGNTIPEGVANSSYEINKIDVPVLLGLKFLKFGNIFLGPNFQYLLKSKATNSIAAISYSETDDTIDQEISVGAVIGVGVEVWKLGLDVRFETGFNYPKENLSGLSDEEAILAIGEALGSQKPNQIIIGLSYKF